MLIVVEDRYVHGLLETLLDHEAVGRPDVLEIDTTHRGLEKLTKADDVLRILRADFEIEHIDAGELLEEHPLTLHDRLRRARTDVPQTEYRCPIRHYRDQISSCCVLEYRVRIIADFETGGRHSRSIRERQLSLRIERLGGNNLDLPGPARSVVLEGRLATSIHSEASRRGEWVSLESSASIA